MLLPKNQQKNITIHKNILTIDSNSYLIHLLNNRAINEIDLQAQRVIVVSWRIR